MEFRSACKSDIDEIMDIIKIAQKHFKDNGIDQWQNNYPNHQVIEKDIENKSSYVLIEDEIVVGTVMLSFDGEETYSTIYEGEWLSHGEHAVIHRIAIDFNRKGTGLASNFMAEIEKLCKDKGINSIKVDTHRANIAMQRLLLKNGYKQCGIIYLKDKNERLGFEKLI